MNPLLQSALGSILRALLAGLAGWFVQRGVWTQDAANEYLTAGVLFILTILWAVWTRYKDRLKFLTALDAPAGIPEEHVTEKIKLGMGAKLTTLVLAVTVAVLTTACRAPVTITTPQGKVIYSANEVAKRVENLQTTVIAAEASKAIPTDVARVFVTFTVESAKVLRVVPQGWQVTVAVAWGEAKKQIPLKYLNDPAIQVAVLAVDTVLAVWLPVTTGGGL